MKLFVHISLLLIFVLSIITTTNAQTNWMRVTSDNGEFSAEVPQTYDFFYDKDGFMTSKDSSNYKLEQVHIFTSFQEKTLISFECYKTKKSGAEAYIEGDNISEEVSEINRGAVNIRQRVKKTDDYYLIRQYFRSKTFLYIVTAASRDGETAPIKRFIDSINFNPDALMPIDKTKSNFSTLKTSNVELKVNIDSKYKSQQSSSVNNPKDPSVNLIQILMKPRPSYVDIARMKGVQGTIVFKIVLNSNGFISKFEVIKLLPEGLVRQAVFAAMRIRFLPQETNGIAEIVEKQIEYHFTLY